MQIGIRLHDINLDLAPEFQTMEARAKTAREEGFSCVHLAFQKNIKGVTFDDSALTEGLAKYTKRVFDGNGLDIAVLGCYLNLAHPDPEQMKEIKSRYYGHMRVASLCGACMVGTETGAPNPQYKMDANTHTKEALNTFIHNLADVVECAEEYGMTMAIEPVWKHIVYGTDQAVEVLEAIQSRNLRIIFDPVNILCKENMDNREYLFRDAIDRLGDKIAMIHLKDFVPQENGELKSIAAGTGLMNYETVLRFAKERKPFIHATLENTFNHNAVQAKEYLEKVYASL